MKTLSLKSLFLAVALSLTSFTTFAANFIGSNSVPDSRLQVYLINVGHGDAILLQTPTKNVLIDAGLDSANDKLIPFLKSHGVTRLDYLLLTHMDPDHIGGVPALLESIEVDKVWTNGTVPSAKKKPDYPKMENALLKHGLREYTPHYREKLYLENDIWLDFNNEKMGAFNANKDQNNNSMTAFLQYGNFKMMLAADVEAPAQTAMFEDLRNELQSDIYKVHHHGSKKFDSHFIQAVNPKVAAFSGKIYPIGFPSKQIKKLFSGMNVPMYFNDPSTVQIQTNGDEYSVSNVN